MAADIEKLAADIEKSLRRIKSVQYTHSIGLAAIIILILART